VSVSTSDGAELAVYSSGDPEGVPVLLCHGGPGMWDYLEPVAELLPEHSVHRFDQRGCGRSSGPEDYTVARAIEDIEDLRRFWGYQRWRVFGHSWGATLALAYAWTHPERVESLVYCSGVGPGTSWNAPYHQEADARLSPERLARRQQLEQRDRDSAEEVEYLSLCWCTDYADLEAGLTWAQHDAVNAPSAVNVAVNRQLWGEAKRWSEEEVAGRCQQVTAPTLVMHGEADPRPLWNARRMADMIPAAKFVAIPRCGHQPWRENPEAFALALRGFLRLVAVSMRHAPARRLTC
jgi:proline iminopeptidase